MKLSSRLQEMDLSPQAFLINTSARHSGWQAIIQKSLPNSAGYILVLDFPSLFVMV